MKLLNLKFSKLLKLERPKFAEDVIRIIDEHDPEVLKVNELFTLLQATQPVIDELIVWYRAHPKTAPIRHGRELRNLHVGSILQRLKVVRKEEGERDANVILAKIEIGRYLSNLRSSKNESVKLEKVDQFYAAIDADEDLENAFSELGFTGLLNELRNVHSSIKEHTIQRDKSIAARPKMKTKELENIVDRAIINMFKEMELAPLRNPDVNYDSVFAELNKSISYYTNLINIRIGQSERKAEEKAENENGELDNTTPVVESTEPAGRMMNLNAADMNGDGEKVLPANEKKTIATTSNSMQLPLNDSEAKNDANTN